MRKALLADGESGLPRQEAGLKRLSHELSDAGQTGTVEFPAGPGQVENTVALP